MAFWLARVSANAGAAFVVVASLFFSIEWPDAVVSTAAVSARSSLAISMVVSVS